MGLDFDAYNRKTEARIVNEIQEMMRVASIAVREVGKMIYIWLGEVEGRNDESYNLILNYESESDIKKRAILNRISLLEGLIHRQDYMRLVFELDQLTGYCAGTASRLNILSNWKPEGETSEKIQLLTGSMTQTVDYLKEAVFLIMTDNEIAVQNALKVDESEVNTNRFYRELLAHLWKLDLDHKTLLMAYDFTTHLEDISDIAERAADAVSIIAVAK